jgi:hypothetical protein
MGIKSIAALVLAMATFGASTAEAQSPYLPWLGFGRTTIVDIDKREVEKTKTTTNTTTTTDDDKLLARQRAANRTRNLVNAGNQSRTNANTTGAYMDAYQNGKLVIAAPVATKRLGGGGPAQGGGLFTNVVQNAPQSILVSANGPVNGLNATNNFAGGDMIEDNGVTLVPIIQRFDASQVAPTFTSVNTTQEALENAATGTASGAAKNLNTID